ncbi:PREDICTED: uncharacterized protein LOC108765171 [Trachymyrmex cornetzi]|uniref:uncharacterized protein LOC108765171 n=1 Tax=Trachymyrmex cornetzi TaxID=471704 RepID=UPI00084F3ECA|nr:PREDICTED: uncharacterized protein LOC108765171 [Trachymyrmex cornetzi]
MGKKKVTKSTKAEQKKDNCKIRSCLTQISCCSIESFCAKERAGKKATEKGPREVSEKVNNATARVQTKKPPTVPNVCVQWPEAAALRGVAIQRGRVGAARATFPTSAAALALARNPGQLAAAAAATALHPFAPAVYYDPFLAAHAATQDPNYRLQLEWPQATADVS